MASDKVIIYAMGDRQIQQGQSDEIFRKEFDPILPIIKDGDIRYAQMECMFSEHAIPIAGAPMGLCLPLRFLDRLQYVGIDVTSPNGNHNMEYGTQAMIDCIDELAKRGMKGIGGGKNIDEARKPALFDVKGNKIAFLAYNSAIREGEQATGVGGMQQPRPGVAPMRIDTFYQNVEVNQPGAPPRIRTFANEEDLEKAVEDIKKAKASNDIVIVAYHAGVHFVRARMADYQFEVTHAMVDAGADLVLGTHPHVLKAFEVFKGKVIFHSLANFGFDKPRDMKTGEMRNMGFNERTREQFELYGIPIPEDTSKAQDIFGAWSDEALMTGIAKIIISNKKIEKVSFLPVLFDKNDGPAKPLKAGMPAFDKEMKYIHDITVEGHVKPDFKVVGDELVIPTPK